MTSNALPRRVSLQVEKYRSPHLTFPRQEPLRLVIPVLLSIMILMQVQVHPTLAASPQTGGHTWARLYKGGGETLASLNSVDHTFDGGYILAGNYGDPPWVVRLDRAGDLLWQRSYGGTGCSGGRAAHQTFDGGYIVLSEFKTCLVKLDSTGNVVWQKMYNTIDGSDPVENAYSLTLGSDGGFLVSGIISYWGDNSPDGFVLRTDSQGNILWHRLYGGPGWDEITAVQQTSDGGYIVAGNTESFGSGGFDAWILKLDTNGDIAWQKSYGGPDVDKVFSLIERPDGGFYAAGHTLSFGAGSYDIWILSLENLGNIFWQKTYGSEGVESAVSLTETTDGELIIAAYVNNNAGFLRLDSRGTLLWQRSWDAPGDDAISSVQQTPDGGFIAAGWTKSFLWPPSPEGEGSDALLLRLDRTGLVHHCSSLAERTLTVTDSKTQVTSTTGETSHVTTSVIENPPITGSFSIETDSPCPTLHRHK